MRVLAKILNDHEISGEVERISEAEVPAPGTSGLNDWAETYLFALTGTGEGVGEPHYTLTILECDDPALVGKVFTWGW